MTVEPTIAVTGDVYVGTIDGSLTALSASGSIRWSVPVGGQPADAGDNASIPEFIVLGPDGTVYVVSAMRSASLASITAIGPDGTTKWSSAASYPAGGIMVGTDDVLILADTDGNLVRLSDSGTAIGSTLIDQKAAFLEPVMSPDGTVYVGSVDGRVFAIGGTP